MSEELHHECGIAAVCLLEEPAGQDGPASQAVTNGDLASLLLADRR